MAEKESSSPPRRTLTPARSLAALVVTLLALALAGAGWLLRSSSGAVWLLGQVPGLRADGLRGELWGPNWSAERLRYELDGDVLELTQVRIDGFGWDWVARPRPGEPRFLVRIESVAAATATWRSAPAPATPTPPPNDLRLPVMLVAEQVSVKALRIDDLPQVTDVHARAVLGDGGGAVHRLQNVGLRTSRWVADGEAELAADAPLKLGLHATIQSAAGAATPWAAQLALTGPLARLEGRAHLSGTGKGGPFLDASATVAPFAHWPLEQLELRTDSLDLAELHDGAPRTRISGEAHARTSGLDAPATVEATLTNSQAGRWSDAQLPLRRLHLLAQGKPNALDTLDLQAFTLDVGGEPAGGQIQGRGSLRPDSQGSRLQLQFTMDALHPASLDRRLPAMTLRGPVSVDVTGLPAWGAPASTASSPAGGTMNAWHAKLGAKLEGQLDATRAAPRPPAVQLEWNADLNARKIVINDALARTGQATAHGAGELTMAGPGSPWAWKARAELSEFDPQVWWAGTLPNAARHGRNRLNGRLESEGRWSTSAPGGAPWLERVDGHIEAQLLPSQWSGLPVSGELSAHREPAGNAAAKARIDWAGNLLTAEAQANGAASRSVELSVDAPSLASLGPWLAGTGTESPWAWLPRGGQVRAHANATWPDAHQPPAWAGELHAAELKHPQWQVAKVDASLRGGSTGESPLALTLDSSAMAWGAARVDSLRAEAKGSLQEHQLTIDVRSPIRPPAWVEQLLGAQTGGGTRMQLAINGHWQPAQAGGDWLDAGRWDGRLNSIEGHAGDGTGRPWLAGQDIGIQLAWGAGFELDSATASAGRLSLAGTTLRWKDTRWHAPDAARPSGELALDAQLDAFEVAPILARAQPDLGWKGDLVLAGELQLRAGERMEGDLVFQRQRGDLSVADDARDPSSIQRPLGLTDLRLGLTAHDGTWHFTTGLAGKQIGEAAGVATVHTTPGARWPGADAPLDGVFQLHVAQLAAWGGWVPPGWRLGGEMHSSAILGGHWGAPELSGRLAGERLEIRNGLQGVQLTDGTVAVSFQGAKAHIERFDWRGGEGALTVSGDGTFGSDPHAALKLHAERLRVLGRLDRRLVASGDAALDLSPRSARLSGRVQIDEGLIDFSRGDAPALDDDVQVAGRPAAQAAPADAASTPASSTAANRDFDSQLDVTLDLGKALRVKGRGIETYLRGALQVANPQHRFAVRGDVRAEQGTYAAYGQKLDIQRGLLSFNGPIEDPRLDILAVRPNLDVQVGVEVTGSATNPRVRLYSDPDMGDTDKLSWLVLGRAPDGLGRADSALLLRAGLALLSGEGEAPTDAFLRGIGLTDLSVRQTGEGEAQTTTVSLGRQLSRRWYVGYERSANAATGTWQLIYRIAQRFTLRAQSGTDSAVDLIWSWRWD